MNFIRTCIYCMLLGAALTSPAEPRPRGLMLNLDFQQATNGLIPNKSFYPLYVPVGDLQVETLLNQPMLVITPDHGLTIPHSSLLQPDGNEWIISVRVGARPDGGSGMVVSQIDDTHGYAIYLKEGAVYAAVRTADSVVLLYQEPGSLITDCRKQMVTIDLRIRPNTATLMLNRDLVATAPLTSPLAGEYMPIRIGQHQEKPSLLDNLPETTAHGIDGAISVLMIRRQ